MPDRPSQRMDPIQPLRTVPQVRRNMAHCPAAVALAVVALVSLGCSRPATKEHSSAPAHQPAALPEKQPAPAAPPPGAPTAATADTADAAPPDAPSTTESSAAEPLSDEVTCSPAEDIIAAAVQALTNGFGLPSVEPQYVELGDLNRDGRPERAGFYKDDSFSFSWVLTEVREGCFRPVMNATSGVVTKALPHSTRGWRDLELQARLNGLAGPAVTCDATFVARFDGTRYGLGRVVSAKPATKNAEISTKECRKQAQEIADGE
jgi:hypothetical protein